MPRLISIVLILALLAGFVPAYAAEKESLPPGMVAWSVEEDSPAAKAGVREDDLLLSCDGKPVVFLSSLTVILNKARKDGKKTVKLTLERDETKMSLDLPVSDESGVKVRPPMSVSVEIAYYGCLSASSEVKVGDHELITELSEAADNVEKDLGDLRLAAWTWRIVHQLSPEKSPEQRRAAGMYTKLSAKIGDRLSESEGLVFQGMIAQNGDDPKSADSHYTNALKIQEELIPGSLTLSVTRFKLISILHSMAGAAYEKSDYSESGRHAHRALKLAEQLSSDPDRQSLARELMVMSLQQLALLANLQGDAKAALGHLTQVLTLIEQLPAEGEIIVRDEAMLDVLNMLGGMASRQEDWKAARDWYVRALDVCERLAPGGYSMADILWKLDPIVRELGDLKAARGYLERLLPIREGLFPDSGVVADTLYRLGQTASDLNDLKAARDYYERALKIREREKPDSDGVVSVLRSLGSVSHSQGDLPAARRYYERALAVTERISPDSMDLAACLNDLAVVIHDQGDLPAVRKLHERALVIKERLAPESESLATALNNLGAVCREQGDMKTARGYYERALKIREQLSPDSLDVASSLNSLGLLVSDEGDLNAALACLKRALAIEERLSPDSVRLATVLGNLGTVFHDRGDFETAEKHYRRSLSIKERLSPNSLAVATSLNNLGVLASDRGDIASSRSFHGRALAILERLAPGSLDLAATVSNLGNLAADQGDFRTARGHYDRALEIQQRLSPDSLLTAVTLGNLGVLASSQDDHQTALEYYRKSMAIEERLAPDSLQLAQSLSNIAAESESIDDLDAALNYYRRALEISQRLAPDSLDVATISDNLGVLATKLSEAKTARQYHERALAIRERLAPDSLDVALSLHNLGRVIGREGDTAAAVEHIERAIRIARKHGGLSLLSSALNALGQLQRESDKEAALGSFKEAVQVFESIAYTDAESKERVLSESESRLYDDLIQLLLEMNRPDEALKYLERAKSKAVVDALNVSSIRTGNDALTTLLKKHSDLQANLKAQQQAIEKEKAKPRDERSLVKIEQLTKLLAQTKAEFYQVVNQIRKQYGPEYSALMQVEPTEFSAVQKQLPKDAVVVEYFPAEDKLYVFIVTGDSFKVKEHAVTRDQLDLWVEQVRQSMDDWKNGLGSETPPDALVSLHGNLIAPVEEEIAANKTVVFVPSGTLCYLPFTALAKKDADGKLQYLVERDKQFVTLTQMGLLGKLLENERFASEGRSVGAIAFGNPTGIKPALPSAENEVNAIAGIYPDSKPFTGDDATEWRVKLQAQYGRIVHLATHAMLRHDDPNESYIALMEGENEDGRLTEGEIFGLPLEGTRLVVLSACQTAVAEDNPGREISSLAQAFAIAGAPTVIASLWSVSDASTGKLMTEFYRGLGQGKSKSTALRDAQRSLLIDKEHGHPFFWASFTLLGAWE